MSPPTPDPEDLEALGERLDEVHKRDEARKPKPQVTSLGVAFRMGTELIAAVAVGVAIGWGLDWVFGTRPVFILIMFVLGAAAGMRNVIVLAKDMNTEMLKQFPPPPPSLDQEDD